MKGKVKGDLRWWMATIFTVGLCLVFLANVILRSTNNDIARLGMCVLLSKKLVGK